MLYVVALITQIWILSFSCEIAKSVREKATFNMTMKDAIIFQLKV